MNNTPALQPMAATRDDRDAAARRRDTAGYRMSQAGLIEAGVDAASEDSADEYSSPSGDTFSDMILKLLKQMTGGGDVVDINIYNLLHAAGLDEFLVDSLRAAMQLDGEAAPSEEALEIMTISAQEAVTKACLPVTAALEGAMANASKFHTDRFKDLMASGSGNQGNDSQQKLDRLREEETDVAYRASYHSLEERTAEISTLKDTRASMLAAREKLTANPMVWKEMKAKSADEIIKTMDKDVKTHQVHIDEIDKCIKSADKQIADAGAKRHLDLLEKLGVSASVNTKDAIPAEFEALIKLGLMPEDKHTAVKADQIRTWMTNFLTKHSTQFWAVLPVIYRMMAMNPNRDLWKIPTSNEVCAADWEVALVQTGVGPLVAEHFNQQNMELLTLMQSGKGCLKVLEAAEQELTHGDEGNIERTVQGKKDDWIAHLEAFYWPNALTSEKDRNKMTKIMEDIHVEFLRANQDLDDSIKVATKIITLARRMQVTISYNKCAKRIVRSIMVGRKSFAVPEILRYMNHPDDPATRENCIHMLCDMLAKIGRAAKRYSTDHSGESVQVADIHAVNAAMASTGLEISVTPGFTDQDTYDSMIVDLCPQFARSDYVTSQHSINFAGGGTQAIKKPYNRGKGGGKGGGRGRGGGRGGRGTGTPYQKQVIRDIIYPKGQLSCSIVGCTNILSIPKSDTFRATDKKHKSAAALGGRKDPHFVPVCSNCWSSDNVETLNQECATPGKEMNMPKFRETSGHTGGYRHSANAATAVDVDNSDNISDAGSMAGSSSGASVVSTAESARADLSSAIAEAQRYEPTLKVTMESSSDGVPSSSMDVLAKTMGDMQNFMTTMQTEQRASQNLMSQQVNTLQRQQLASQANQQSNLRAGGLGGGYGTYVPPNGSHSQQQIESMGHDHRVQFPLMSERVTDGMERREMARRK